MLSAIGGATAILVLLYAFLLVSSYRPLLWIPSIHLMVACSALDVGFIGLVGGLFVDRYAGPNLLRSVCVSVLLVSAICAGGVSLLCSWFLPGLFTYWCFLFYLLFPVGWVLGIVGCPYVDLMLSAILLQHECRTDRLRR